MRARGTIVTIGTFDAPVSFNPFFRMTRREIKLQAVMGRSQHTWRRMMQLVDAEQVRLAPFITHILPLAQYQEGFALVKEHRVQKVLLQP